MGFCLDHMERRRPEYLDLLSGLDFPLGTCCNTDSSAFNKSSSLRKTEENIRGFISFIPAFLSWTNTIKICFASVKDMFMEANARSDISDCTRLDLLLDTLRAATAAAGLTVTCSARKPQVYELQTSKEASRKEMKKE